MMKEVFFSKDDKTKARYEELRSVAAKKMKDKYEGMNAEEILNLTKKNSRYDAVHGEARAGFIHSTR